LPLIFLVLIKLMRNLGTIEFIILSLRISPKTQEFCPFSRSSIQISTKTYLIAESSFLKLSLDFFNLLTAPLKAALGLSLSSVSRINLGLLI